MTYTCECGEIFESRDDAEQHVNDAHTADIDERLQEYIGDAFTDAYKDLVTEDE